jgi:high affinity Mn2+ porin
MDLLARQGFGLSKTLGVEDYRNGDAYTAGTASPNYTFARLFIRQTVGFGGDQADAPDDPLTLAGSRDVPRITVTIGRVHARGRPRPGHRGVRRALSPSRP